MQRPDSTDTDTQIDWKVVECSFRFGELQNKAHIDVNTHAQIDARGTEKSKSESKKFFTTKSEWKLIA